MPLSTLTPRPLLGDSLCHECSADGSCCELGAIMARGVQEGVPGLPATASHRKSETHWTEEKRKNPRALGAVCEDKCTQAYPSYNPSQAGSRRSSKSCGSTTPAIHPQNKINMLTHSERMVYNVYKCMACMCQICSLLSIQALGRVGNHCSHGLGAWGIESVRPGPRQVGSRSPGPCTRPHLTQDARGQQ